MLQTGSYQEQDEEDDVDSIPIVKISLDPPGTTGICRTGSADILASAVVAQENRPSLSKSARPRPAPQAFVIDTEGEMPAGALLRDQPAPDEAAMALADEVPDAAPVEEGHHVEQVQVVKRVKKKSKRPKEGQVL